MNLSKLKNILQSSSDLSFKLFDGTPVPSHFHVTEIGHIQKHYIDCGGVKRAENVINFQLWHSTDIDHRLAPKKFLDIIALAEAQLMIGDFEIEVEYQSNTISKYALDFDGTSFILASTTTNCLAPDQCGVPEVKPKLNLADLMAKPNQCDPNSGCC